MGILRSDDCDVVLGVIIMTCVNNQRFTEFCIVFLVVIIILHTLVMFSLDNTLFWCARITIQSGVFLLECCCLNRLDMTDAYKHASPS